MRTHATAVSPSWNSGTHPRPGTSLSGIGPWLVALLLLIAGLWSHAASAQAADGCDLQSVAPTQKTGAPGTALDFQFQLVDLGSCETTGTSGSLIIVNDTTGGASVSPTGYSHNGSAIEGFTITMGPTAGRVDVEVVCETGCGTTTLIAYTAFSGAPPACDLQAVAPTAQTGATGSNLDYQFDVIDLGACNASGVSGAITVAADTTGGATVSPGGFSGIDGRYGFTLTLGPNPGTVSIGIHCDASCPSTLTYSATATAAGTASISVAKVLTSHTDPDSSDTITQGDVLTYTVTATNNGNVGLTNVRVHDQLTVPSIAVCANVAIGATCVLTGTHTVTAGDAAAGSISNIGAADSNELPDGENTVPVVITVFGGGSGPATLAIVSGNNQNVATGSASAPMVVVLHDGAGQPVANATIAWASNNGSLAHATTTTDGSGQSSNTATLANAGAASVTASSAVPAAGPVSFTLQGATAGLSHLAGLTPTQRAIAVSIDNACPALAALSTRTPAQDDLLARCTELEQAGVSQPSGVGDALGELATGSAYLQSTAALQISAAQFDNIKARIAALRSGTGGDHFGGLAFNGPSGSLPMGKALDALLGATDAKPAEAGAGFSRWGFFAAGTFGRGSADRSSVLPGFDFDTSGFTAGVDYRYSDTWIVGATAGFARFNSALDGNHGRMDTRGWSLSAYSTMFRPNDWYVDTVVTWGHNRYAIDRRILYSVTTPSGTTNIDTRASANASGSNLAGSLTVGRDFQRGGWSLGPYLRGNLARLGFDDYSETLPAGTPGSGLGLAVRSRDVQSASSVLGGKASFASSQNWGVLMPHIQVEWEHEFKDDPYRLEARFLNDPTSTPFVVQGDKLDADYFRLGLGLSFVGKGGRSGFVYYEKTLGREGISQDNIALGIRIEF